MAEIPVRTVTPLLVLVALFPVVLFVLDRGETAVWLSFASVLIVAGSVFLLLTPAGEERETDHAGAE